MENEKEEGYGCGIGRPQRWQVVLASAALVVLCSLYLIETASLVGDSASADLMRTASSRHAESLVALRAAARSWDDYRDNSTANALDPYSTNSSVVLCLRRIRGDRMGSRLQITLGAWITARRHGWFFCNPPADLSAADLGFPICHNYDFMLIPGLGDAITPFSGPDSVQGPGVYAPSTTDGGVLSMWEQIWEDQDAMFSESTVTEWRRMIFNSKLRPDLDEIFWKSRTAVTIAINVRRGDIMPGIRNDIWVDDRVNIGLIEAVKSVIRERKGNGTEFELHIFSETYGEVNWHRYNVTGDVVHLHLAKKKNLDIEINYRDWKHFVTADVLIAMSTFSRLPALARPGPGPDGLPMTVYKTSRGMRKGWVGFWWDRTSDRIRLDGLRGMPDGTTRRVYPVPDRSLFNCSDLSCR
mmetsp:Transcript_8966/g.20846  ORF Transcript_8966/g.20846 Transcript_8966/m.20846 type:complete len:412 (-) Transcript_8966:359-1594(-)